MKTPQEYVNEEGFKQYGKDCTSEAFNDPDLNFVIQAVLNAQKDAYNQAIEDAAEILEQDNYLRNIMYNYLVKLKSKILQLIKL